MAKTVKNNIVPDGFEVEESLPQGYEVETKPPKAYKVDEKLPSGFEVEDSPTQDTSNQIPESENNQEYVPTVSVNLGGKEIPIFTNPFSEENQKVLEGKVEAYKKKSFGDRLKETILPKWEEETGRFTPEVTHPEATWLNGALDLKDITKGGATLLGKTLKGALIDVPTELYDRAKNHEQLITGKDFQEIWENTKRIVPEVGEAIIHPYKEAVKGNFKPMLQNPLTTTLDLLSVGEVAKLAKLGRFKSAGKELADLAKNPQKYVAETERPIGLSQFKKAETQPRPAVNELMDERPLNLNEFTKIQNEKLNQFAPTSRMVKVEKGAKTQFIKNLDELKTDVHKKQFITGAKKGNFFKKNISDPLEMAIIDAEESLNSTINKIKKNPSVLGDENSFNKINDDFNNVLDKLPDEAKDDFYLRYYNALDEAENFNKTGYVASVRLPQRYQDYYNEYLNLYNSGHPLAKSATQEYFQKYGQKLHNPNYPKSEPFEFDPELENLSSEEIFKKMQEMSPKNPIFTTREMDDKIGKIFNKHTKYSQARSLEIEGKINDIIGDLSKEDKADLVKYLQDPMNNKNVSTGVLKSAEQIRDIVNTNTKSLVEGGYLAEKTAQNNPYKQAVIARWIENNKNNFTPSELKQLAESGELKTYAGVNDMDLDLMKAEYEGSDIQPTYLNVNYGDRTLLDKAKQKLGIDPDVFELEQPVPILNKRKYGLSPKIDVDKSLNTYLKSVEKLQANRKIIDEVTHNFSMPLDEFGKIKKGYTVWSPELIMQEIREKGYAKSDEILKDYFDKNAEDIYRTSTKEGFPIYQVPERAIKTLSGYYYKPKGVDKVLNKLNQPFKRYALATGRFIVNNTANNFINNMIEGVPLKAYKAANNPKLKDVFPTELQDAGFFGSEKNKSIPLIEKGINAVTNKVLPFKSTQNVMTKVIDWIFDTNSNIENSVFRANYIKQMQDLATHQGVGLEEIINNPQVQDLALENTYKSLGDYNTKKPLYNAPMWEDGVALTSVIPFARPFVEQSKVMAHQFVDRPTAFNAVVAKPAQIGSDMARDQKEEFADTGRELREYQERAVYQGYYYDSDGELQKEPDISQVPSDGKPVMYDSSSFLPHSIIGDYTEGDLSEMAGKLNPLVGLTTSAISGNKFGEIPLTAPDREWGKSMSSEDKLSYLVSQILRTYTPAGSIEKMLPYRSYDSQLFVPDKKARAKTPFYYSGRFFGGTEMVAPKAKGFKKKSNIPNGFEIEK